MPKQHVPIIRSAPGRSDKPAARDSVAAPSPGGGDDGGGSGWDTAVTLLDGASAVCKAVGWLSRFLK